MHIYAAPSVWHSKEPTWLPVSTNQRAFHLFSSVPPSFCSTPSRSTVVVSCVITWKPHSRATTESAA